VEDPLNGYSAMMTPAEVAEYLNISEVRLASWRSRRVGPPWVKVGEGRNGAVRYPREALRQHVLSNTYNAVGERPPVTDGRVAS
jgi:helix-turn-helix protein